ncbi:hypothetical protein Tco_0662589, partial [Tanacetum coccineum]
GFDSNEEEVVPKVDDVSLVDGVFDDAFGGDGDEDFVIGEGIRGGGLGGSHGSRRKVNRMMMKMMKRMREDERRMVDRRRMKRKLRSDLFSCHNPFESFALVKRSAQEVGV